ncbi:ABC transporter substrate-binding protein [Vibrio quintilis]|uniref:Putative siderophore-binding lipoprotein YfiY n=1 Tax=Vibrio quintilis TaxID=1117707 RepID=A0A1M7Z2T5_9VIBR|nr:iron-siderophore ABC transporter substrate-binding protein [Vibrio quintilis]SHO59267.1 putative siderophore-binding lipoprotein YfiY precursor [Vibrio quintilis]
MTSNRRLSGQFVVCLFAVCLMLISSVVTHAGATEQNIRQIHHAMGVTTLSGSVHRVVTLFQGATDTAVALGIQPVGVVDSWAEKPTYHYLRPQLAGVKHVGLETQPNLERIAALHPDLIIGSLSRHEKIYRQLSQIAPVVLTDNVYNFHHTLELVSMATGRNAQGKALWQQWQNRVAVFSSALSQKIPGWPLTAAILDVRADHLRLYLQDSFPGKVLEEIGFRFPLEKRHTWGVKLKTKESLPQVNADVFFVILHSDDQAVRKNYQRWRAHPLWKILKAPREGQVYPVDRVRWLLSGGILGANRILDQLSDRYQLQDEVP